MLQGALQDYFILVTYITLIYLTSSSTADFITLQELTNPEIYNASERPPSENKKGESTAVGVKIRLHIFDIDLEKEGDAYNFVIRVEVQESWYDRRLTFPSTAVNRYIATMKDAIWYPDLIFNSELAESVFPQLRSTEIYQNGTVFSRVRLYVSASVQRPGIVSKGFSLRILSLNYTNEDLRLLWDEHPIELEPHSSWETYLLDDVTLNDIEVGHCESHGIAKISKLQDGNYSCLYIKASKSIEVSPFLLVYIPSALCVILSWTSFWMEESNVIGRCLPAVIGLIHLLNQKTAIMRNSLLIHQATVLDTWVHCCVGFSLAAMLQVVCVSYLYIFSMVQFRSSSSEEAPTILMSQEREEDRKSIEQPDQQDGRMRAYERKSFRRYLPIFSRETAAGDLNAISRWLFPLSFVMLLIGFYVLEI